MNQRQIRATIRRFEKEYSLHFTEEEFEQVCAYLTFLRICKLVRS